MASRTRTVQNITLTSILLLRCIVVSAAPSLQPRVLLPGEGPGPLFWLYAPNIAIVTVDQVDWLGSEIEVTSPQKLVVRLVSVQGQVENVLKGGLQKGPVQFYFFANTLSPGGFHTVLSWYEPKKRYAVFLREDSGALRTMADVTEPNIRVCSGRHERIDGSGGSRHDPGFAIASAALTPGLKVDTDFAACIEQTRGEIAQLVAPYDLVVLLRKLLTNPDPEIDAQACLTLSRNYLYRDPCLRKALNSDDPDVRQQATMWARRKQGAERLVGLLRDEPLGLSISGRLEDLEGDLETFTFDSDGPVRRQACAAIRHLFPTATIPECKDVRASGK